MEKCVILDRDGVINQNLPGEYITNAAQWVPIPGALEAIARLNKKGFLVAVATNQSGVGRGYYSGEALHGMHVKMCALLAKVGGHIDYIAICPHHPDDDCHCRKPKPGLLQEIAEALPIDLADTYFVGDKVSDMQAAHAAGCKGIFLKSDHGHEYLDQRAPNTPIFEHLAQFVDTLLKID